MAATASNDFLAFFQENRIYLDKPLCDQILAFNQKFAEAFYEFHSWLPFKETHPSDHMKAWLNSWKKASEDIPPIREGIESRFRELLGVQS